MEPRGTESDVDGGRSGLVEWVAHYGDRLVQFAYTYLHDWDAAQDVAQETFARAMSTGRHLTPGWLFTVAHNLAVDEIRRRHRVATVADCAPAMKGTEVGLSLQVTDALQRLSRRDRECLWLFYYADLSLEDVGKAMGLSASQAKGRLYRARRRFAVTWGTDQDGGG